MRYLVTGGAGFIGSHLADHLVRSGHEVVVLDNLFGGFEENVPEGVTFVKADVCNANVVDALCAAYRFDWIFHTAAYAAEGLSHFIRRFNYENNVLGSMSVINAAAKNNVRGVVFTSSIAVYGEGTCFPFTEYDVPSPIDPYGIAKYAVEMDLAAASRLWGLKYVVFRCHNVYGPRQNIGDRYRNVVGIYMNCALQGKPFPVYGSGDQTRSFTYIDDVVQPMARAPELEAAHNRVFNLGADAKHSVLELGTMVAGVMGVPKAFHHLPPREEAQWAHSAHYNANAVFGSHETPLRPGLQRMALWVQKHGVRRGKPFENVEVLRGMPKAWR